MTESKETKKRPIGLSLLAFYIGAPALYGLVMGIGGLLLLVPATIFGKFGEYDTFTLIYLITALLTLIAASLLFLWEARELWRMSPMARLWTIRLTIGTYLLCCIYALIPATEKYIIFEDLLYAIPLMAIILIYLNRPQIRQLFTDEPIRTTVEQSSHQSVL